MFRNDASAVATRAGCVTNSYVLYEMKFRKQSVWPRRLDFFSCRLHDARPMHPSSPTMPAFLFDLDGTLLDSSGDLADAANVARAVLGLPPLSDTEVALQTGRGLAALLAGVLPDAREDEIERGRAAFVEHYGKNLMVRSRPYPGVPAMFDALAGHLLALVTNKPAMFTMPLLVRLGWRDRFPVVVCGDTTPERKPAAGPLLHAIRQLDLNPADCVFVGDTPIDQEAAESAGVRFVCVSWGRAAATAGRVVERLDTLPELFRDG